jgi:hypothetical protein
MAHKFDELRKNMSEESKVSSQRIKDEYLQTCMQIGEHLAKAEIYLEQLVSLAQRPNPTEQIYLAKKGLEHIRELRDLLTPE